MQSFWCLLSKSLKQKLKIWLYRHNHQRTSLLGKPVKFKTSRRDARIKKAQALVYNFLERPSGKAALCYHAIVFCFVFMCLALSVFATIEEHEEEAGLMLYYLEIVIVIWFGIEFFIRPQIRKLFLEFGDKIIRY